LTDEAIPLSVIEPFNNSLCQTANLLLRELTLSRDSGRHSGKGNTDQSEFDLRTSRGPLDEYFKPISLKTSRKNKNQLKKS